MQSKYFHTPKHFILSQGVLRERDQNIPRQAEPKTIDYEHTVRVIDSCRCSQRIELSTLKDRHRQEIQEKQKEIARLRKLNQTTHDQIQPSYLDFLQQSKSLRKPIYTQSDTSICSSDIEDFSQQECPLSKTAEEVSQLIHKIETQIEQTENSIKYMTNILQKEKKKYVSLSSSLEKIKQTTIGKQGKELGEAYHLKTQNELIFPWELNSFMMSMELTETEESQDITPFMEYLLKEHRNLKQTLLELECSTNQEMQKMKKSYEGQISQYIELLNQQKDKNETLGLNYPTDFLEAHDKFDRIEAIELQSKSIFEDEVEAKLHLFQLQ